MKVMIGYDGSDSVRDAIRGLHRAGLPRDTEFIVVSVADVWPPLPQSPQDRAVPSGFQRAPIVKRAHALAAAARGEAQAVAAAGAALVKGMFPGSAVAHATYAGSPHLALIEPPGGVPDLVVVGSRGRSALGRFLLGSVSQNVLNHATCSVRISRSADGADAGTDAPVRILLGVDGSVPSALAVSAVASRAWPEGSEVKVVAVLDLKLLSVLAAPESAAWAPQWASLETEGEDDRSPARRAVEAVAEELRCAGLVPTPLVEEGDPKRVLVEEAERWKADCIFLGARGHGRLERFLLGSVSAAVAARASCSVEVVRQG